AVGGGRLRGVDRLDARMRMRRHHHHAVALPRQRDVIDIAAASRDEALVLDPAHRLADAELVDRRIHRRTPRLLQPPRFSGMISGLIVNRPGSVGLTVTRTQWESGSPNTSSRVKWSRKRPFFRFTSGLLI